MARTVCDHYWKFTSESARPYPSLEHCIFAQTRERPCDARQAQACADFARTLKPVQPGKGLEGNTDCAACLGPDPSVQKAFAEQRGALERSPCTRRRSTTASGPHVASNPYTERLTKSGKPVAWDDPGIVDEPDLRIVAYFVVPTSQRGKKVVINYDGKLSKPFELR